MDTHWPPTWFCQLTSRMDWLPSGLILKDPVWIIFFGSIWEMAHSISSTRALQAAWRKHTHTSEFNVLIVEQTRVRGGHGHTSTFHVLSLSRCLDEAQEETQNHTRREQRSRFSHLAPSVTVTRTHTQVPARHKLKPSNTEWHHYHRISLNTTPTYDHFWAR